METITKTRQTAGQIRQNQQASRLTRVIDLPARFILTSSGSVYCTKKQIPLRVIRTHEGRKEFGFIWDSYQVPFIQQLVADRLLGAIDIDGTELLSQRSGILDMTKALVYSILHKKFKPTLNRILLESDIIKGLRRSNPKLDLGPELKFNSKIVADFIKNNEKSLRSLKASLLFEPYSMIENDASLDEEQKLSKKRITRTFIDIIDSSTWFLFHFVNRSADKLEIMAAINRVIISFMTKTKIADYIGLMVMELIQNCEKAHYENLASRDNRARIKGANIDNLLKDEEFRLRLKKKAEEKRIFMNLNYRFDGDPRDVRERMKLQIAISNKGMIKEKERKQIQKKAKVDTSEVSLADFYHHGDPGKLGAGLGLFYLSYIEEACKEEDIRFDAKIVGDEKKDETIAIMNIQI